MQRSLHALLLVVALVVPSLAQADGVQFNGGCSNFTWNQNTEPDFATYKIYDRTSTSADPTLKLTLGQAGSITCAQLQLNSGQHYTSISATDLVGNESPRSEEIPYVIVADNQVSDLRLTAIGATTFDVAFTQVDDGAGAAATYDVRVKTPTMDWGTATSVTAGTCSTPLAGTSIGATMACTITGLSATTAYEIQLVPYRGTIAVDAVYGPLSNVAGGTTGGVVENLGDRTITFSDTFTRADGVLTSPWEGGYTQGSAALNLTIVGNKIRVAGTTNDATMTYNVTLPNDQWCEFTIATMTGSGTRAPRCILAANAPGTLNAYEFTALVGVSGTKSRIMKWTNGSASAPDILVSENSTTWAATDVLRAEKRGSTLTLFRNGTQLLTTTNTSYTGGRGGIMNYSGASAANVELDNVRFGTFAVAGSDICGCN